MYISNGLFQPHVRYIDPSTQYIWYSTDILTTVGERHRKDKQKRRRGAGKSKRAINNR
jgi:hypothetical protein